MKKLLAILMVCVMSLSTVAFAAEFTDVEGHWAATSISAAADNGLITGSNGLFRPNDNMTRAEMATIIARACGAVEMADLAAFTDMDPNDWTYASMSKAVAMGAFNGSGDKLNPNNFITRQEAFTVLSRVFGLSVNEKVNVAVLNQFSDGSEVAEWFKNDVAAIIASGYVGGSNGKLNPNANITRAEFATVMGKLIQYYVDDETATTIPTDGNVMIRVGNLKIDGVDTKHMVVIGDGVGQSNMSIANSHLDENLIVRAGQKVNLNGRYAHVKILRPNIVVEGAVRSVDEPYTAEKIHKGYAIDGSEFLVFVTIGNPSELQKTEEPEAAEVDEADAAEETEVTDEK